jgi:D-alanine--poly(phosphoribitol) ligase subunit 2
MNYSQQDVEAAVEGYLREQLLVDAGDLGRDNDLLGGGVIDSFGYIELVLFVERTFDVTLSRDEMVAGGLVSIAAIGKAVVNAGRTT